MNYASIVALGERNAMSGKTRINATNDGTFWFEVTTKAVADLVKGRKLLTLVRLFSTTLSTYRITRNDFVQVTMCSVAQTTTTATTTTVAATAPVTTITTARTATAVATTTTALATTPTKAPTVTTKATTVATTTTKTNFTNSNNSTLTNNNSTLVTTSTTTSTTTVSANSVVTNPTTIVGGLTTIQLVLISLGGVLFLICLVATIGTLRKRAKESSLSKMRRKDSSIQENYLKLPQPPAASVGFAISSSDSAVYSVRSERSAASPASSISQYPQQPVSPTPTVTHVYQPTGADPMSFPEPNQQYQSLMPLVPTSNAPENFY